MKKFHVVVLLIVLSGVVLLVQGFFGLMTKREAALPNELRKTVLDFVSQQVGLGESSGDLLAVFARTGDCPACLEESLWWKRLSQSPEAQELRIVVFLNGVFPSELDLIQKNLGDGITVRIDTTDITGKIRRQMETPAKFLIHDYSILSFDSANYYREEKEAWLEGIRRNLRK